MPCSTSAWARFNRLNSSVLSSAGSGPKRWSAPLPRVFAWRRFSTGRHRGNKVMGKPWISGWLNLMGDFLFPGNCPVCGDAPFADPGSYACRECMDRIAWIRGNGCRICGLPMWGMGFGGLTCRACREDPPVFQSGRCLFLLDETGKKVIHEIKYHGVRPVLPSQTLNTGFSH